MTHSGVRNGTPTHLFCCHPVRYSTHCLSNSTKERFDIGINTSSAGLPRGVRKVTTTLFIFEHIFIDFLTLKKDLLCNRSLLPHILNMWGQPWPHLFIQGVKFVWFAPFFSAKYVQLYYCYSTIYNTPGAPRSLLASSRTGKK